MPRSRAATHDPRPSMLGAKRQRRTENHLGRAPNPVCCVVPRESFCECLRVSKHNSRPSADTAVADAVWRKVGAPPPAPPEPMAPAAPAEGGATFPNDSGQNQVTLSKHPGENAKLHIATQWVENAERFLAQKKLL